jgi:hypothetical protein
MSLKIIKGENIVKIDYRLMKNICLADISAFESLGKTFDTQDGIYIHIEKPNSKILAVAHLDTVLNSTNFKVVEKKKKTKVYNMQLDDRLGVYTILDLLPKMGIECDILLTEGEEIGNSTAQHFESDKYNWIFSFDRHGEDAVLYEYGDFPTAKWETALKNSGFRIGVGSFSDIAFMEHLKIKGVNIGTGYEGEHFKDCYARMDVLERQIYKFKDFYEINKDTKFPHEKKPMSSIWWGYSNNIGYSKYNPYYRNDAFGCYLCEDGVGINPIENIYLCDSCFAHAGVCADCEDIFQDTELVDGRCIDCGYFYKFGEEGEDYGYKGEYDG